VSAFNDHISSQICHAPPRTCLPVIHRAAALDIRCRGNRDVSAPAACVYFHWSDAGPGWTGRRYIISRKNTTPATMTSVRNTVMEVIKRKTDNAKIAQTLYNFF